MTLWRLVQLKHAFLSVGYDEAQAQVAAEEGVQLALEWRSQFDVPQQSLDVLAELGERIPLVAITNGNVDLDKIGLTPYFQCVLKRALTVLPSLLPICLSKRSSFSITCRKHSACW